MAENVQPIQPGHRPGGKFADALAIAERGDEMGVLGQGFESWKVQMVEMIMGNQDEVWLGHVPDAESKGREILDKKEQAIKYRINQNAALRVLDQDTGMVDKSDTQSLMVIDRLPIERYGDDHLSVILIPETISGPKLPLENVYQAAVLYMPEGIYKTAGTVMTFLGNDFFQVHSGKLNQIPTIGQPGHIPGCFLPGV
jgi:hypothetical protein